MTVHRQLGPGLFEGVYESALCVELELHGLTFQRQVPTPVVYKEGFIVAAGFSGHGFMQGPAIGLAIAELVLDGQSTSVDVSAFRPSRVEEGVPHEEHNLI